MDKLLIARKNLRLFYLVRLHESTRNILVRSINLMRRLFHTKFRADCVPKFSLLSCYLIVNVLRHGNDMESVQRRSQTSVFFGVAR